MNNRLAAAALVAALVPAAPAAAGTAETRAFSDARLAAFGSGDIEALIAQYADDAVIVTPDAVLTTAEERRALITATIGLFADPTMKFQMIRVVAEGDLLHYVWTAETDTMDFGTGVETYIIRDGKAVQQTEWFAPVAK